MQKITGHEYPVSKIFNAEFDFEIPSYQRPYSWTTEETRQLLDDIIDFMDEQQALDADDPYFLGSIVLIKQEGDPKSEVIDGQQRLTTLTILLSVIVDRLTGERARTFEKYINEPGDLAEGRDPMPRLKMREKDREFFHKFIQENGHMDELASLSKSNLSDPRKNIQANAYILREALAAMDDERVFELGRFVVNRCYIVVVSTPSMQSAYRIFSVLNDRGLDLLTSDILKADIVGQIQEDRRDHYTKQWEDIEESLGRESFDDLFSHIRMIYVKAKLRKTILEEFRNHIVEKENDPERLMDDVIVPYAEAFEVIITAEYRATDDARVVNDMLHWLRRIDNVDWVAPAILFTRQHENDVGMMTRFFESLERLAASMFIRRVGINERIERYANLLRAIESNSDLWATDSPLLLTNGEKKSTRLVIDGDIYNANKRVRTYILLRLDSFLADRSAAYDHKVLTVEHVLPQTVRTGSDWERTWPDIAQREEWLHRLGNLVLLSRRKNTQASNADFKEKKERYFRTRAGVSTFALTTKVLEKEEWTPETVDARHREMVDIFVRGWKLKPRSRLIGRKIKRSRGSRSV